MPTYQTYTRSIINELRCSAISLKEDGEDFILTGDDYSLRLPSQGRLAARIIRLLQEDGITLRELAQQLDTAASTLTNVRKGRRTAPWELAARIILLIGDLPTPEEADHMFMELRLPGLFTETYHAVFNRRNHILRQILDYGQTAPCPCADWLAFTLFVMHRLGLPFCQDIIFHVPDFPPEVLQTIDGWKAELKDVSYCDYSVLRRHYLTRYRQRYGMHVHGGIEEAEHKICDEHFIGFGSVQNFFANSSNPKTKCGRETIIRIAIALGCTLSETNEMLRQANEAVLYANLADREELELVQKLLVNGR